MATEVLPGPQRVGDVRFVDAAVAATVAAGSVLFTASRPTLGSQLGWGVFWTGLGALGAVEGQGTLLRFGSLGLLGANASYLALRLLRPDLRAPKPVSGQFAQTGSGFMA